MKVSANVLAVTLQQKKIQFYNSDIVTEIKLSKNYFNKLYNIIKMIDFDFLV